MEARLLPQLMRCPFCGGAAEVAVAERNFDDAKVRCHVCSAEGPLFDDGPTAAANVASAAEHWNTRFE